MALRTVKGKKSNPVSPALHAMQTEPQSPSHRPSSPPITQMSVGPQPFETLMPSSSFLGVPSQPIGAAKANVSLLPPQVTPSSPPLAPKSGLMPPSPPMAHSAP